MSNDERSERAASAGNHETSAMFTVLVPLDGSALAARALPIAASICAKIPGSELICMNALPMTALPGGFAVMPPYLPVEVYQQMWDDQERLARSFLAEAVAEVSRHGVRARPLAQRGDAAATILDAAARLGVNLIVMTSHGRTGLARFTLGSVADRIVRGSVAPVLLVRSFQAPDWSSEGLRRVLTPLDGSLLSEAPLTDIIPQLAGSVIQDVTLLQVVDPRAGEEAVVRAENYLGEARQRLIERLDEEMSERTCAIQTLVRAGPVSATILSCVEATSSGVIIMATHSEMGIGRLVLGSVTDSVLRDGHTPLLLAHPRD